MAASSKKAMDLFVTKIPWTVARNDLVEYFGQFGLVIKCRLPFNLDTGFHKGHCWVGFKTEKAKNSVLEKDRHVLDGTTVQVQIQTYRNGKGPGNQKSNSDTEHD
ncbi:SRA stem-loop-interacting RNA-binding protein, mitochondrial isoform X2 [Scophthalmus maximus]|uniref:SRA stem-loop interacting RNA binding protein n=1 Tax=Scophthalmus maximus TaxID=52904 RepID=A0A8D3ANR8_SCOMX|nr:SRA stem-loop-interacting RNA-binding protein, mitochondrial isoform X2 [Scophthalmus maximus]